MKWESEREKRREREKVKKGKTDSRDTAVNKDTEEFQCHVFMNSDVIIHMAQSHCAKNMTRKVHS